MRIKKIWRNAGTAMLAMTLLLLAGCNSIKAYSPTPEMSQVSDSLSQDAPEPRSIVSPNAEKTRGLANNSERKIYYNGSITSRATSPENIIEQAISQTQAAQGYIEQRSKHLLVVRVPVAEFKKLYQQFLSLTDVMQREITALDITEQFIDRELRLRTSKAARDRMIKLLADATDEEEKIKLLTEIQRLNQRIENLETEMQTLEKLSRFSKIIFHVLPRQTFSNKQKIVEDASFQWINRLSPFNPTLYSGFKPHTLPIPKNMVELERKDYWASESADGVILRSYQRTNNPQGDTPFWHQAINHRLASEFAKTNQLNAGKYTLSRFVSRGEKPYIYWVGVRVVDQQLRIIESYFPDRAHEKRYRDAINAVLEGEKK